MTRDGAGLFPDPAAAADDTPHHHGHRDRLRRRFIDGGAGAIADYELVELILFAAIPRRDVKPLAKSLIARFGGFGGLAAASPQALENAGLGEPAIALVKSIRAAAEILSRTELAERPLLNNWDAVTAHLRLAMAHGAVEEFRVLFLDKKNRLIADEVQARGTVDQTPAYPREVVKRALELGASAVILAHNHPSGDPAPSRADIALTQEIVAAAKTLGIAVHDHVIIGRHGETSLRNQGHF